MTLHMLWEIGQHFDLCCQSVLLCYFQRLLCYLRIPHIQDNCIHFGFCCGRYRCRGSTASSKYPDRSPRTCCGLFKSQDTPKTIDVGVVYRWDADAVERPRIEDA